MHPVFHLYAFVLSEFVLSVLLEFNCRETREGESEVLACISPILVTEENKEESVKFGGVPRNNHFLHQRVGFFRMV